MFPLKRLLGIKANSPLNYPKAKRISETSQIDHKNYILILKCYQTFKEILQYEREANFKKSLFYFI